MKKFLLIFVSLLLILAFSENSFALRIEMGRESWVDTSGTNLDDAYYKSGWWPGPDGSDCISETVTLSSVDSVSEPANMLLMGTALVGLAIASRKKTFKRK